MRSAHRSAQLLICLIALAVSASLARASDAATRPTTQPSGAIAGSVKSPTGAPLPGIVVYLAPEENQSIDAPTQPVTVSQKGAQFSPPLLIICKGQSVDFLNDEDRPIEHNVFSNSPTQPFDLGLYKPGESRSEKFNSPGPVLLYCSIHRRMDGVIYVAPSPYFSQTAADGTYRIEGIPSGRWEISTWQHRRRFQEAHLTLNVIPGPPMIGDLTLEK